MREHDGFRVAEEDLHRRGAGELLGLRQAGESTEGLALAEQDVPLFLRARDWIAENPDLARSYMNEETTRRLVP